MPPAEPAELLSGGLRTMHELAVGIAATGRRVEVRGQVDVEELGRLGTAAGVTPELPTAQRRPTAEDVVLLPEGLSDPLAFAPAVFSGARVILMLLAPPGLFGWPFAAGWRPPAPASAAIGELARPEHFQAIAEMGCGMWTHMPRVAEVARAAGVPCHFIGNGRPLPYPAPPEKCYDAVIVTHNRWVEPARAVAAQLKPAISCHEIGAVSNDELLRQLGQARLAIHPSRIEGHSRIGQEARAMGTVPVVLDCNPFAVGLDEASGAVPVSSLEEMPGAVEGLLGDAQRLRALRERAVSSARAQVDWQRYLERIEQALSAPRPSDPAAGAREEWGRRFARAHELEQVRSAGLEAELRAVKADRDELAQQLRELQATRAFRLAKSYWQARARMINR